MASLARLEHVAVAFGAGLELGDLAVGAALGAAGHRPGGGAAGGGVAAPGRRRRRRPAVAAGCGGLGARVGGAGEPLVGVAADEASGDALLVEVDGALGVAVLLGTLGSL